MHCRLPRDTHHLLQLAAKAAGHSLTKEIENRLERSFELDPARERARKLLIRKYEKMIEARA